MPNCVDWGVASQSNPILNAFERGREDPASLGGVLTYNEQQSAILRHARAYKMVFLPKDTSRSLPFESTSVKQFSKSFT